MASKKKIISNLKKIKPFAEFLASYHRYEVRGLENIPQEGSAIIAMSHSLATYDVALLFQAIYDEYDRVVRSMAGHLFFKLPFLGTLVENVGAVDGDYDAGLALLKKGELVGLCPGGVPEATRPSEEAYQLRWQNRRGFIKLAMATQAPIILAVCPRADDLYRVYNTPLLRGFMYEKFKAPFFLARGLGFSLLPRPIKLTHWISEPIYPPKPARNVVRYNLQVRDFHAEVTMKAEALMQKALAYESEGQMTLSESLIQAAAKMIDSNV